MIKKTLITASAFAASAGFAFAQSNLVGWDWDTTGGTTLDASTESAADHIGASQNVASGSYSFSSGVLELSDDSSFGPGVPAGAVGQQNVNFVQPGTAPLTGNGQTFMSTQEGVGLIFGNDMSGEYVSFTTAFDPGFVSDGAFVLSLDRRYDTGTYNQVHSVEVYGDGSLVGTFSDDVTGATAGAWSNSTISLGNVDGYSEVEVRYVFASGSDAGFAAGLAMDNVIVQGGSAVPEPSTYAAIFGAVVLGLAVVRRRMKKTA